MTEWKIAWLLLVLLMIFLVSFLLVRWVVVECFTVYLHFVIDVLKNELHSFYIWICICIADKAKVWNNISWKLKVSIKIKTIWLEIIKIIRIYVVRKIHNCVVFIMRILGSLHSFWYFVLSNYWLSSWFFVQFFRI